jgi:hypothetical protein
VSLCISSSYLSSFRRFLTQLPHSYRIGSWDGPETHTAPFDVNVLFWAGKPAFTDLTLRL